MVLLPDPTGGLFDLMILPISLAIRSVSGWPLCSAAHMAPPTGMDEVVDCQPPFGHAPVNLGEPVGYQPTLPNTWSQ